jgi:hypothetical protein
MRYGAASETLMVCDVLALVAHIFARIANNALSV